MANNFVQPPANTGAGLKIRTVEVTETSGPATGAAVEQQIIVQGDPTNPSILAAVTLLHQGFNQPIPTGGSTLNSGVAQVQNASGKLDPTLEAGQDGVPARGIPASMTYLSQQAALTTCAQNVASSAVPVNLLVASSTGFTAGGIAIIDTGTSTEGQVITAVPDATHVTVDHLNNNHNGTVTPFLVTMVVCNQARDAAGELDVALGIGAATAIEYEYDGISYLRGRNVFGVSGLYTDSVAISAVASTNPVAMVVTGTPPAGLQIGHALIIDPLGATPEMQQIIAINAGTKTITVKSLTNNHTGTFRVFAAIQSLNAVPNNLSGVGVAAEATLVYSGQDGTTGVQRFSVEKDINALALTGALPINPVISSSLASGMAVGVEFGAVDTVARTFGTNTLIPDQHGQGGEDLITDGGRLSFAITQANVQGGATVMKPTAGRLCRLLVTTATAVVPLIITDGVAGTIIGIIPIGATIGSVWICNMPALASINIPQAATWTGAVTASYY